MTRFRHNTIYLKNSQPSPEKVLSATTHAGMVMLCEEIQWHSSALLRGCDYNTDLWQKCLKCATEYLIRFMGSC